MRAVKAGRANVAQRTPPGLSASSLPVTPMDAAMGSRARVGRPRDARGLRPGGLGARAVRPRRRPRRAPGHPHQPLHPSVGVIHSTVGPRRGAGVARPRGRRQARDICIVGRPPRAKITPRRP